MAETWSSYKPPGSQEYDEYVILVLGLACRHPKKDAHNTEELSDSMH